MRAWEFLDEDRSPPSMPITLRALHKMKLNQKHREAEERERHALMRIMYSDQPSEQEQLDLDQQRLELEQLRADIKKTEAETAEVAKKSAIALHTNARSGIDAAKKNKDHITKMAKSGLGREKK